MRPSTKKAKKRTRKTSKFLATSFSSFMIRKRKGMASTFEELLADIHAEKDVERRVPNKKRKGNDSAPVASAGEEVKEAKAKRGKRADTKTETHWEAKRKADDEKFAVDCAIDRVQSQSRWMALVQEPETLKFLMVPVLRKYFSNKCECQPHDSPTRIYFGHQNGCDAKEPHSRPPCVIHLEDKQDAPLCAHFKRNNTYLGKCLSDLQVELKSEQNKVLQRRAQKLGALPNVGYDTVLAEENPRDTFLMQLDHLKSFL